MNVVAKERYPALKKSPQIPPGYPDISKMSSNGALNNSFKNFNDAKSIHLSEGEILYRVLDPKSADNSICWMRESEYKKLKTKADWRRYFAVFASWNSNGEYLEYTKFQC